jgi:hypothetical protein
MAFQIVFVSQYQQRDILGGVPGQQLVQGLFGDLDVLLGNRVDHKNDTVGRCAVLFPRVSVPPLATQVPDFQSDLALLDLSDVDSYSRDRVFHELTGLKGVDQGALSGILETDNSQFQFFGKKSRFKPLKQLLYIKHDL